MNIKKFIVHFSSIFGMAKSRDAEKINDFFISKSDVANRVSRRKSRHYKHIIESPAICDVAFIVNTKSRDKSRRESQIASL